MNKYVVAVTRIPTNYNDPRCYIVEAATPQDARTIMKHQLRDLANLQNNVYEVKPYEGPPPGRVLQEVPA